MNLRDVILAAKPRREKVPLPELGIDVWVRGMAGVERDAFEEGCFEGRGAKRTFTMKNMRARLVAFCCIDEEGQRVFSDADASLLGETRADILDRLFSVAQRLSAITKEDADDLGGSSASRGATATSSSPSLVN